MDARAIKTLVRPHTAQASYAAAVLLSGAATAVAVAALVLLAGCDQQVVEEDEVDCYESVGLPPACVSWGFYHLHPAWHPGGQQIAYLRPTDEPQGSVGLFIYDLSVGDERFVVDVPAFSMSSQAWSPDGEWVVFGAGAQIYKIRFDGSDLTQLTFSRENFDAAWSPDGESIAYTDATPSAPEQGTYIMRPDGSEKQWLPHVRGGRPVWHPSGEKILTIGGILPSFEDRLFQDYLSDPTRRDTLNPHGHIGVVHTAAYSDDGSEIVFDIQYKHASRWHTFKIEVVTHHTVQLTGDPAESFGAHPAWSPDGQTIAYVNNYWREGVIWLMDPDGSNRRRMGPVAPPWFPQGR